MAEGPAGTGTGPCAAGAYNLVKGEDPGPADAFDGECVIAPANSVLAAVIVVDCDDEDRSGKVVDVVDAGEECPDGTERDLTLEADSHRKLCLDEDA